MIRQTVQVYRSVSFRRIRWLSLAQDIAAIHLRQFRLIF